MKKINFNLVKILKIKVNKQICAEIDIPKECKNTT